MTLTRVRWEGLLHILNLDDLAGDALRQSGSHEAVEIAVEHVTRAR